MNDDDEDLKAVLGRLPPVKSHSYLAASAVFLVLGLIACWIAFGTGLWIWYRIVAGTLGIIRLVAGLRGIRQASRSLGQ
jgi:O-antigen/teichoic acid export membrane protein